jgi:hypothetical protein
LPGVWSGTKQIGHIRSIGNHDKDKGKVRAYLKKKKKKNSANKSWELLKLNWD